MRRPWIAVLLLLVAGSVVALVVVGRSRAAGPSTFARGPEGWLAARLYLEARGVEVTLLDHLPGGSSPGEKAAEQQGEEGEGEGDEEEEGEEEEEEEEKERAPVLVTAFPWKRLEFQEGLAGFRAHLEAGGTLVLAASPRGETFQEQLLLAALGLDDLKLRSEPPPWGPLAWKRWQGETWRLVPVAESLGGAPPSVFAGGREGEGREGEEGTNGSSGAVIVRPPTRLPAPPPEHTILYRREGTATPVIWSAPLDGGRLVVLPADALSNSRLGAGGNGDLLESLRVWLGDRWAFDEYHHGLLPPEKAGAAVPSLALDLFGLHLALLYGLGVWHLARRFGSPWREPPVRTGSAGAFLRGLGRLHDRLGHHREAAVLLLARSRELSPHLPLGPELDEEAAGADGKAFVELARKVAEARRP